MIIVAMDTSTPVVTAGVVELLRPHELPVAGSARPVRVLAEHSVTDAFGHAENLMPLLTAALSEAELTPRDIEAVVAGLGPGPFTGLRVGIATAAALGDALGVAAHGIVSHDAVAARLADSGVDGEFLVVTDARRREVYVSSYFSDGRRCYGPAVHAPATLPTVLAEEGLSPRAVGGDGAALVTSILGRPPLRPQQQWSGFAVACAARPLLTGAVPGPLEPLYLRRPDATVPHAPKPVLPDDRVAG